MAPEHQPRTIDAPWGRLTPAVPNDLHVLFISAGLFFGDASWRWMPRIEAWPSCRFCLYALFVALF
ncbi:MAG: hypothetical protein RLZZ106_957 [Cyanobacteriota bacterium]|jgi:hypothetical protein